MGNCNCRESNRRERRTKRDRRDRRDRRDKGTRRDRRCRKLDPLCAYDNVWNSRNDGTQSGQQTNRTLQDSEESVEIIDSSDVTFSSTDTKGALNIQAGLQAALVILVTISIFGGDSSRAEQFTQELMQSAKVQQLTYQQTYIENSSGVTVEMNDTQLSINIQILLQLLLAVAVVVDIF